MSEMEVTEGQLLSQDFGVGGPPTAKEVVPVRPLAVIEAELDMLKRDTRQKETALLCNYIEFGRRLEEVKAQLPHGQWGGWLKKMEISQSTANNFMRLFREYGTDQQSLFGGTVKSQAFANLTYSKAVLMLMVPEEDRERFMAEHDVDGMSNRELKAAIKAKDEAEEKAAVAQDEADRLEKRVLHLQEEIADQAQIYKAKLTSAEVEAKQAREAQEKAAAKAQCLQDALSEANTAAQAAEAEHAKMLQELEELRNRPAETDTGAVEAARKAAIEEMTGKVDKAKEAKKKADTARKAAEEALAAAQKELAELKAKGPQIRELTPEEIQAMTAGEVEKAQAATTERMQALEKQLAQADTDTTTLMVLFKSWKETYTKMWETLHRIEAADSDKARKLRGGIRKALEDVLEQMA